MSTELTLPSGGVRQGDTLTILQLARHPHPAHTSTSHRWTHAWWPPLLLCCTIARVVCGCYQSEGYQHVRVSGGHMIGSRPVSKVTTFFWWNPSLGGHTEDISWQRTSIYRHGHISPDIGWDIHSNKPDNVSRIFKHTLYFVVKLTNKQNISKTYLLDFN